MKKRIGILTGGGDVQPLNTLLSSVKKFALKKNIEVFGFLNGWQGVLDSIYIPLSKINIPSKIGGTILRSSRVNVNVIQNGWDIVINNLRKLKIDGLIVIGGEDTLSNSFSLLDFPQVLISKTIDNDVGQLKLDSKFRVSNFINHFTLGHPTAAHKLASFVSYQNGVRTTAYSHQRIMVVEAMGMHAGWLALSSCMGNPDFIIIPEFPLNYDIFIERVENLFKIQKHVIIVVAEGAKWNDGSYISADESETDDFGHPRFKGSSIVLAERIKKDLSCKFNTRNVNSINPSYLYRSGSPNFIDEKCANILGKEAVKLLLEDLKEPVFLSIKYSNNNFKSEPILLKKILSIKNFYRLVDESMYDINSYYASENAKKYWKTMIKEFNKISYGI